MAGGDYAATVPGAAD